MSDSSAINQPSHGPENTAGERARFTPGPWQSKYGDYAPATELAQIIGNVDYSWHGDGLCYTNVCEISESTDEAANTRLICAAPDLYEALNGVLDRYCDLVNSGDCGFWDPEEEPQVIAARAALAKAEGL